MPLNEKIWMQVTEGFARFGNLRRIAFVGSVDPTARRTTSSLAAGAVGYGRLPFVTAIRALPPRAEAARVLDRTWHCREISRRVPRRC
jgi:hypothetical protein